MDVDTITGPALASGADTIAVGLLDGETDVLDALGLRALLESGEAKSDFRHLAVGHAGDARVIVIGLGAAADLDDERLRIAAALVRTRAANSAPAGCAGSCPATPRPQIAAATRDRDDPRRLSV